MPGLKAPEVALTIKQGKIFLKPLRGFSKPLICTVFGSVSTTVACVI